MGYSPDEDCDIIVKDDPSWVKFICGDEHTTLGDLGQRLKNCKDMPNWRRQKLQQHSLRLVGFPLVLQLMAYRSIPLLLKKVPNANDDQTFMDASFVGLSKLTTMSMNDVLQVENDEELLVTPVLPLGHVGVDNDGWGDWDDEDRDRSVLYMQRLIRTGFVFEKSVWPGGIAAVEYVRVKAKKTVVKHVKYVFDRKGKSVAVKEKKVNLKSKKLKKSVSQRKQQKLETYFHPATRVSANLKGWIESQLDDVKSVFLKQLADQKIEIKMLKKKQKGKNRRSLGRLSRSLPSNSHRRKRARKEEIIHCNLSSNEWQSGQEDVTNENDGEDVMECHQSATNDGEDAMEVHQFATAIEQDIVVAHVGLTANENDGEDAIEFNQSATILGGVVGDEAKSENANAQLAGYMFENDVGDAMDVHKSGTLLDESDFKDFKDVNAETDGMEVHQSGILGDEGKGKKSVGDDAETKADMDIEDEAMEMDNVGRQIDATVSKVLQDNLPDGFL
ncbi:unnamed protein product [Arabis nemorensis]|uniref:Uncharacterized protein n=1 Tax=Arabis nemorensis TaxID=586526 RepID=A0A565BRR5_9BRAS|nr:unnamed protein product [Arabis nemorensis]